MVSELEKPVNLSLGLPTAGGKTARRNEMILAVAIPVSIAAVLLILYFKYPKFRTLIQGVLHRGGVVSSAPTVSFVLNPEEVKPNSAFSIQGQFQDAQGNPVKVKAGYYYVFEIDSQGNKQAIVTQGSLGNGISQFSVLIPTTNWTDQAKFAVDVTDQAFTAAQLTQMINPTGKTALGAQSGYNPSNLGVNPVTGTNVIAQNQSPLVQSIAQV